MFHAGYVLNYQNSQARNTARHDFVEKLCKIFRYILNPQLMGTSNPLFCLFHLSFFHEKLLISDLDPSAMNSQKPSLFVKL